jgi:hypothetical protein
LKVTYTEEAIADIVEAISYLNEPNPTAAGNLDAEIARCIERLAAQESELTTKLTRYSAFDRSSASGTGEPLISPPGNESRRCRALNGLPVSSWTRSRQPTR